MTSPTPKSAAESLPLVLLENLPQGLYYVDENRRILHWSPAAERITGWRREEVLGRFCGEGVLEHLDEEGRELCGDRCPLLMAARLGAECRSEVFLKHRRGHRVPVQIEAAPVRNGDGSLKGMVESFWDNTRHLRLAEEKARLERLALLDPLTGAGNRRAGMDQLQRALDAQQRYETVTGVVMLDIDHFKRINDRFGHETGDDVLRMVAETLAGSLRSTDFLARWGGEEFLAILPHTTEALLPRVVGRLLRLVHRSGVEHPEGRIRVTVSAGVTALQAGDTVHELVDRADRLLYLAKQEGRNRFRFDGRNSGQEWGAT
ncbi:MAG TPA: sensor domain-containing diguanylate cyclase [Bryobacteraceae bacterium]|nr:sensor domain-containing diguanylate cyclase [Bryobacterales bacterium]HRJ21481.1 sensor domain-containing diguanylate cyclase [Bryobacteraceae bacterium]